MVGSNSSFLRKLAELAKNVYFLTTKTIIIVMFRDENREANHVIPIELATRLTREGNAVSVIT